MFCWGSWGNTQKLTGKAGAADGTRAATCNPSYIGGGYTFARMSGNVGLVEG